MLRKRLILLLGSTCFLLTQSYGQFSKVLQSGSVDSKMLPSGSSGNSNATQADLFNGTANISIPISKDISLSYNTGGVKVDEPSGAVGLHWNLNAFGSITRVLKDVPDEMNVTFPQVPVPDGSNSPTDAVSLGMEGRFSLYNLGDNSNFVSDSYVDDESDDFIFSVQGLHFTFNIGKNGFIFTNPHKNVKIDLLLNGSPVTTASNKFHSTGDFNVMNEISFRVRDPQGNWYYFQKGDVSHKTYGADPANPDLAFDYISKWVIKRILKADGSEINYQYNIVNATSNIAYMAYTGFEQGATEISSQATSGVPYNRDLAYSSNISSISYSDGTTANFIYANPASGRCDDPGNVTLSEIQVLSVNNGVRFILEHGWALSKKNASDNIATEVALGSTCQTIDATPDQNNRYFRLLLKGIHIASLDLSKTEPYYSFIYNTSLRLPPRLSGAQDHFGYFNGLIIYNDAYNGTLNIPIHNPRYPAGSTTTYGVSKEDNWNFAIADILDTVKNAYGGKTAFVYEPHVLSNVLSDGQINNTPADGYFYGTLSGDGVRVAAIITLDDRYPGKFQKQSFVYSGGQRFLPGGVYDYPVYTFDPNGSPLYESFNTAFNSNFVSPHQFVDGFNHGYSNVIETQSNDQGQLLSKSSTTFQNISRGVNQTSYYKIGSFDYFQIPFTDKQYFKDWEIGLPLLTEDYDQNNRIVSRTLNVYKSILDVTSTIQNVENSHRLSTVQNGNLTAVATDSYRPYTGYSQLMSTTTQKFVSDNNFSTNLIKYHYDLNNNLDVDTTQNSFGETIIHKYIYNYAVSGPNVPYGNDPGTLYNMTNDGLEFQVGTETWKLISPFNDLLLDASITKYKYQNGTILQQKGFNLQSLLPITYPAYTGISSNPILVNQYGKIITAYNTNQTPQNFQVSSEILNYDEKNNPTEIQIKGQNSYVATIWDPIPGFKLAEVQNANYADIAATSFEPLVGVSYTGSGATTNGKFTFDQWGIVGNAGSVSGSNCFKLVASTTANTYINSPILTAGKSYMITFWLKVLNTAGYLPKLTDPNGQLISYTQTYATGSQGWSYNEAKYTPTTTGAVKFSTIFPASYIDEIRIFPTGAMMKNWTYDPFLGVTSSTDPTGRITYYIYDALGHMVATKDQEGNITSKTETHNGI